MRPIHGIDEDFGRGPTKNININPEKQLIEKMVSMTDANTACVLRIDKNKNIILQVTKKRVRIIDLEAKNADELLTLLWRSININRPLGICRFFARRGETQ